MLRKYSLIILLLVVLCSGAQAASPTAKYNIQIENISFKKVESHAPNPQEGLQSSGYVETLKPALNLGFYDGGVWIKFTYTSEAPAPILVIGNPILDFGAVYKNNNNNLQLIQEIGDQLPFSLRENKYRNPAFSLGNGFSATDTVYLFVSNAGEQFYLPLKIWEKNDYDQFSIHENYLFGAYFGILLFALFFNLFITLVLKDKNVFYYTIYLVGLVFLQISLNGFGTLYLWGDNIWLTGIANVVLASISILYLLLFTSNFLSIRLNFPKVGKVLNWAKILVGLNILISFLIPTAYLKFPILFINIITFLFGIVIIPIAYLSYKNYFKQARYFLLAFLFLIFGVFAFVLRNLGIIPNNFISENGLQIGSAIEVILLTFAIIDKFKSFRDEALNRLKEINEIKEKTNKELEEKVKARTFDLEQSNNTLLEQKNIIELKNTEITNSINYGEKIQAAILPSFEEIGQSVKDAFVLFKPKDIVSGDFYWVSNKRDFSFYVVADCTGHGVPGAFMSMIGNSLLSQIIDTENETDTGIILDKLRFEVIKALKQKGEIGEQKDGMDLAIIKLNHATNELTFSGANNPLYIIKKDSITPESDLLKLEVELDNKYLYSIKPTKQPIGFQTVDDQKFIANTIKVNSGDKIYLFTDGYPDQFGGPKGKKLKYKPFKQELLKSSNKEMIAQKEYLENHIVSWMNTENKYNKFEQQTDDICIMGIEI